MPYVTLQQLTERFGERLLVQLTDRAEIATGAIVVATVDRAIADTGAVIDGHLAGRYKLPLGDVPPLLVDLGLIIAIYKLHPFEPDPKIGKDYEGALRALRDISNGVIRLEVAGVEPESSGSNGVQFIDRERELTPENLRGFI